MPASVVLVALAAALPLGPSAGPLAAAPSDAGAEAPAVHTALEAAYPAQDGSVRGAVTEVRLRFTTEVQAALSAITLRSGGRVRASTERPEVVQGSGGRELRLALDGPLPPGAYTVEWRSAGPDSHPIEGSYAFQVRPAAPSDTTADTLPEGVARSDTAPGAAAPPADTAAPGGPVAPVARDTAAAAAGEGRPGAISVAVRWLFFLSVVGMVGTVATRALVLPQVGRDDALAVAVPRMIRGTWSLAGVAAALAVVALPARLWIQSVSLFSGDALGASNLVALLFRSPWGAGWFLEAVCVGLFVLGMLAARPEGSRKRGWLVMGLGALGICAVPGLSGHAWASGALRTPAMAADALHVLAAGVWMGGLGTLVLAGLPAVRAVGGKEALPRLLPALVDAFSRMALVGVGLLVATGVVNAWLRLDAVSQLLSTGYGRTLLLKLAAVAGAMALGFYNWRVVRPSLRESPRPGLVRIPATLEFLLGLIALAVTASLVATALPG